MNNIGYGSYIIFNHLFKVSEANKESEMPEELKKIEALIKNIEEARKILRTCKDVPIELNSDLECAESLAYKMKEKIPFYFRVSPFIDLHSGIYKITKEFGEFPKVPSTGPLGISFYYKSFLDAKRACHLLECLDKYNKENHDY